MKLILFLLKGGGLLLGLLLVTAVILFVVTRDEASLPHTVTTDPSLPHVEIDGVLFHSRTFGDLANPALIVVHGGPGGDLGYLLNLHRLEDEYFVVFYDQRGAGLSPRVDAAELSLASSVADLHRIVTHYGQGRPVYLVGHSWGAMLAAAYIGEHPETTAGVVLAEPGALDNAGLERFRAQQAAAQGGSYYPALVRTIFASLHLDGPDAHAQNDYIFGQMSRRFVGSAASGYGCPEPVTPTVPDVPVPPSRFGAVAFNTLFGPEADLSPIQANAANYTRPVLFLASACNNFIGAEFLQGEMDIFPDAKLEIVPQAGHEMFSDNPTESLAAVRRYFSGLSSVE
jgi:proline iminopeptidase